MMRIETTKKCNPKQYRDGFTANCWISGKTELEEFFKKHPNAIIGTSWGSGNWKMRYYDGTYEFYHNGDWLQRETWGEFFTFDVFNDEVCLRIKRMVESRNAWDYIPVDDEVAWSYRWIEAIYSAIDNYSEGE